MALDLPAQVITIKDSGSAEYLHAALDILFGDGTIIHLSTGTYSGVTTADFGVVDYLPYLRSSGEQRETVREATDQITFTAQNVDGVLGLTIVDVENSLNTADAIFSAIFEADDGTFYQVEIMRGQITDAAATLSEASFKLVSDLDSGGAVAGEVTAQIYCSHRYKRAGCDSPDPSATCDHTFDGANGCGTKLPAARITTVTISRGNQASYGGCKFKDAPPAGSAPGGQVDGAGFDLQAWRERYGGDHGRYGYLA